MIRTILKAIDKSLPPDIWASKDRVLRTRSMVFYFYLDISLYIFVIFVFPSTRGPLYSLLSRVCFMLFDITCLYLIKKSFDIGKIIGAYIFVETVSASYAIFTYQEGTSSNTFIAFPLIMLLALFLSNWKTRIIFLAMIVSLTLSFLRLSSIRIFDQMNGYVLVSAIALFTIGPIYIYLKSRSIMQDDLDHETEWQIRNAKLAEISVMTRTMHSLMNLPLKDFSDEYSNLTKNAASSDNTILLDKMQHNIDDLVRISQSYAWMYRAFQKEGDSSASSDVLVMHLQTLSSLAFEKWGWEWRLKPKAEPVEISGPVPSLMLLLFCIIIQVVENPPSQGSNFIQLEVNRTDNGVNWILSWPAENEYQKSILDGNGGDSLSLSAMRRDLILDLQKACGATLSEYQKDTLRVLKVSGAWIQKNGFFPLKHPMHHVSQV